MSDETVRASAAHIRALILNPEQVAGPREPSQPLTVMQRAHGGEFVGWDARIDLAILMARVQAVDVRPHVKRAARRAASDPSVRNIRNAERTFRRESELEFENLFLAEIAEVLSYHAAALGCAESSATISARSLEVAVGHFNLKHTAKGWLAFRASLLWAEDSIADCSSEPYTPEPLYTRLASCDARASTWLHSFMELASAERLIELESEIVLRGGAGMQAPPNPDLARELDGLQYGAPVRPVPPKPAGRVVVPALDHLPTPSQYARERRDSPRAEYDPIAEKSLPLVPAPDPHAFVQAGIARYPWAEDLITVIAHDLVGAGHAWIRPTLLLGGAGTGKTSLARWLAEALGLEFTLYSVNTSMDSSFSGTSRQWSSGRASVPLQAIRRAMHANVLVGIDEIEKGTSDRRNGRFDEAILPFLERENSRRVFDLYLETAVDLSAVSYVATANDLYGVASPLRDRFRVFEMPLPRRQDLPIVAGNLVAEIRSDRGLDTHWLPDLSPDELELLGRHWRGGSLRPLRRLVEAVIAGRESFATRN